MPLAYQVLKLNRRVINTLLQGGMRVRPAEQNAQYTLGGPLTTETENEELCV